MIRARRRPGAPGRPTSGGLTASSASGRDAASHTPPRDDARAAALQAHVVVARAGLDVSVDVRAGEALAVMGPSGAGKTTLVESLAGLIRIDGGEVALDGRALAGPGLHTPPSRRAVGLLGQSALLFPHMTATENIAFAVRATDRGDTRRGARREAEAWLDRIGLAGLGDRRPDRLSGGQRQRVALARALAARPRLLLLDEPFSSLDVEAAARLREVVGEQIRGTTTIVVSHSAADALALAGRVAIIEHGRMTQQGPIEQVLAAPATSFARAVADSAPR